jgi:hypothetical protein
MPTRRAILNATAAGLAIALVGCAERSSSPEVAEQTSAAATSAAAPPAGSLIGEVAPDLTTALTVVNASFETLTGSDQLFAFGLLAPDNTPVVDADVQVWTRAREGESPEGPTMAVFEEVPNQPLGLYVVRLALPISGTIPLAAVTADGRGGETVLRVADPETAVVPAPGTPAPVAATPTEQDLLGYERLCTQSPPCGMHEVSLDAALQAGEPVVVAFATPGFCETAICGPTVEVVERVRDQSTDSAVRWIHVEIFTDAGTTIGDPVTTWGLQSEPWVFAIGSDGRINGRLDGPLTVLEGEIAAMAAELA